MLGFAPFDSLSKLTLSGAVTLESYTLAADGTMRVDVERPDRKPITLVFQRQ